MWKLDFLSKYLITPRSLTSHALTNETPTILIQLIYQIIFIIINNLFNQILLF
jgi:hypothetical protein